MKTIWIKWPLAQVLGVGLALCAFSAAALDLAGTSCMGNACRAVDGSNGGGSCFGHYCVAGSGGTGGGQCIGDYCQAGHGGTGGGLCIGAGCKAGDGGNTGGNCTGTGCKPGNRGRAAPAPKNMPCCMAWHQLGLIHSGNFVKACNKMQAENKSETKCEYRNWERRVRTADPIVAVVPDKLPAPPTSYESIMKQTREPRPPVPTCPYTCQSWNEPSKSCIGPQMNGCRR